MNKISPTLAKATTAALAAGIAAAPLGHNGGSPLFMPRPIPIRYVKTRRRKDPNDKKRRKPLREWFKKKFLHPKSTPNQRMRLLQQREREIGIHPKYRHGVRKREISAIDWDIMRVEWNKKHGLPAIA